MAAFERDHHLVAGGLNEAIRREVLPHRTVESIKGKRKQAVYKAALEEAYSASAPRPSAQRTTRSSGRPVLNPASTPPTSLATIDEEAEELPSGMVPPPTPEDPLVILGKTVQDLSGTLGVEVPKTAEEVHNLIETWCPSVPLRTPARGGRAGPPLGSRRKRRSWEFALFQEAWKRDRGQAAKRVAAGLGPSQVREEWPEGTLAFWKALFQRRSPQGPSPSTSVVHPGLSHKLLAPITEVEIEAALKATKTGTAPGPDGRRTADVWALGFGRLRWAFNACLLVGDLPRSWMKGRTVLIPKVDVPETPSDFRPLTITPILTRTLHRVLARRLATEAPLPAEQRGFKKEEGCAANLMLLAHAIHQAKTGPRNLYLAFLDFKKAFDSVGHPAIEAACRRWGTGDHFASYVAKIYRHASSDIDGTPVGLSRGVLQGDPVSPALFNMSLDWALSALPKEVGVEVGGVMHQYLAFADDVVLLAATPMGLKKAVGSLTAAAAGLGLEVGTAKCATLGIRADGKRRTWVQEKVDVQVDGQSIRALGPGQFYRYLGVRVGTPWADGPSQLLAKLNIGLSRLQRSPAKPQQKLWALINVIVPQLLYPLLHSKAKKGTLKRVDRDTRRFARLALHMPHDTPLGVFHAAVADGGLGIPSMLTRIPRLREDLMERLSLSSDPAVKEVAVASAAAPPAGDGSSRRRQEREHWSDSLYNAVDTRGLKGIGDTPISSSWISDGTTLMRGGDYVKAVKLRCGLLATRLRSSRGQPQPEIHCDLCFNRRIESLGHVLQQCPAVAGVRTARHNRLMDTYLTELQHKGYQVLREPAIPTPAGVRYPDIVCWRGDRSMVIDVQVVADAAAGSLDASHRLKVERYNIPAIRDYVARVAGTPPVVSTFTVSWRGSVALPSLNTWVSLGLPKSRVKLMVVKTMEGGVAIYRDHKRTSGARVRA